MRRLFDLFRSRRAPSATDLISQIGAAPAPDLARTMELRLAERRAGRDERNARARQSAITKQHQAVERCPLMRSRRMAG